MSKHTFWVIVDGATPTAFRSVRREDLLTVLRQLQRTQPGATLKWFDRGRLWDTPAQAREALRARRQTKPARDTEWRPGGDHVDRRARYQLTRDEKRARFKKRSFGKPADRSDSGEHDQRRSQSRRPKTGWSTERRFGKPADRPHRGAHGQRPSQSRRPKTGWSKGPRNQTRRRGPGKPKGPR